MSPLLLAATLGDVTVGRAGRIHVAGHLVGYVRRQVAGRRRCSWEGALKDGEHSPVRYKTRRAAMGWVLAHPCRPGPELLEHLPVDAAQERCRSL